MHVLNKKIGQFDLKINVFFDLDEFIKHAIPPYIKNSDKYTIQKNNVTEIISLQKLKEEILNHDYYIKRSETEKFTLNFFTYKLQSNLPSAEIFIALYIELIKMCYPDLSEYLINNLVNIMASAMSGSDEINMLRGK